MKTTWNSACFALMLALAFGSCSKPENNTPSPPPPPPPPPVTIDTTGPLKSATTIPFGLASDYSSFQNNSSYRALVIKEASSITFGNEMKHASIVQGDGTYNFTTADAFLNAATSAGISVFGHTLGWHSQQNTTYLKTFSGITTGAGPEMLANPGFESGGVSTHDNWTVFNAANGATVTVGTNASEIKTGTRSLKVVNPVANTEQWRVQVASEFITTTPGRDYVISYWVKSASANGSIRLSTAVSGGGSPAYQPDQTIGTAFQQVNWTITASAPQTRIVFDLGKEANTYYIDDASVKEAGSASNAQIAAKLDIALNNWITAMVGRYKDKVGAWDVINEIYADNAQLRNNTNTAASTNTLVWTHYMGREFAVKAFQYARAADPTALLFINDYNLEATNTAKLDSTVAFVNELRGRAVPVDGIGTQMHISLQTSYSAIDNMFKKLASTGLKVRISELDVRINPTDRADFVPTTAVLQEQAYMYHYVVSSYLKNVPAAQQHGITIWGVDDATSWIVTAMRKNDFPLLFDKNFEKKPAYYSVVRALKGK